MKIKLLKASDIKIGDCISIHPIGTELWIYPPGKARVIGVEEEEIKLSVEEDSTCYVYLYKYQIQYKPPFIVSNYLIRYAL